MRPTGKLHLGHWLGALKNWTELQDRYDCFYFVADWHALTSEYASTDMLTANALDNVADWISAGVDPERSTIFVQSLVPEHAELYLLLSMVVPVPWLERVPTYKEQQEQLSGKDLSTVGFLTYPLLQTADIAVYDGRFVPVGEDQVPHLELSREAIRRFHQFYGEVLVEPQPLLTPTPRLPGLDNRKMSKSYGNTIDLSDDADTVVKKVRQMYTDPKRVRADIPGTVEGNPVFIYHDAFNTDLAEVEDLKARYRAGKVGDVEVKTKLAKAMNAALEPLRERRRDGEAGPVAGDRDRGVAQGARDRARHDGTRARRGEAAVLTPWVRCTRTSRVHRTRTRSSSTGSRARSTCCCT
jgi:tryptophanyl-tRNA synthetase